MPSKNKTPEQKERHRQCQIRSEKKNGKKYYKRKQDIHDFLVIEGICIKCCKKAVEENSYSCEDCLLKYKENRYKKRERCTALGLCIYCGKNPKLNNSISCENCWVKSISLSNFGVSKRSNEIKKLLESQNYCCYYTGIKLVMGLNASIDHKIPTTRGGTNDLSNICWCDYTTNLLKNNLTELEFLQLCHLVINKHPVIPNNLPIATKEAPRLGFLRNKSSTNKQEVAK